MHDLWAVIGVLAAVVLPMVLAWWLLGRPPRRGAGRPDRHGNIRGEEER